MGIPFDDVQRPDVLEDRGERQVHGRRVQGVAEGAHDLEVVRGELGVGAAPFELDDRDITARGVAQVGGHGAHGPPPGDADAHPVVHQFDDQIRPGAPEFVEQIGPARHVHVDDAGLGQPEALLQPARQLRRGLAGVVDRDGHEPGLLAALEEFGHGGARQPHRGGHLRLAQTALEVQFDGGDRLLVPLIHQFPPLPRAPLARLRPRQGARPAPGPLTRRVRGRLRAPRAHCPRSRSRLPAIRVRGGCAIRRPCAA